MKRILVTPRSLKMDGDPALRLLTEAGYKIVTCTPGKQPDEEELMSLLPGCVGYLAGVEPVSARVLEATRDLRVICRYGTGIDNIDVKSAERMKIRVCRARGANARGVAELTLGLIFALFRSIPFADANLKSGRWERRMGEEL